MLTYAAGLDLPAHKRHMLLQDDIVQEVTYNMYAHLCARMLTYAHVCSRVLTYAHVCSRTLTYADVCSRMLMYADVCMQVTDIVEGLEYLHSVR
jgi:hypothetical protein